MSAPSSPRLAVVISHPIQYYAPWFRWMSRHGWTLRVFYLWDFGVRPGHDAEFGRTVEWDVDLLSGYEHEFVPNVSKTPGTHRFGGLDNPALSSRLRAWSPDAILLFGYKYRTHLRLLLRPPAPLVFRGDSHLLDSTPSIAKRLSLRLLFARFAAVTYTGVSNFGYFRAFGVPPERLFFAPHCVDDTHFARTPSALAAAGSLRTMLGLDGQRVVLFAGKLVPKKQPLALLDAFIEAAPRDTALIFVGEGEQLPALKERARQHPASVVRFLPFANQTEMPSRYLLADIFVLPSKGPGETWGLAVNEAMHLGVPCLVSDRVGCQADLVSDGDTGWVFSVDDPNGLRDALSRALTDIACDAEGFRQRVARRIANYTYAHATEGIARAVRHAAPSATAIL